MSEFLEYVLWQLQNSLVLVLLAGIIAVAAVAITYLVHKRKYKGEKKFPWGKTFLWLVFLGYLVIVLYATILRKAGGYREWNLHLFRAWREAWNNFSTKNWANVLLNIAMFGPLGFLLPLIGKRFRKWYATIPTSFAASLAIEVLQLAIGIAILPPLARLLKIDLNTLFCFREELTQQELTDFCNLLKVTAEESGIAAAFDRAEEMMRSYPNNESLMLNVTLSLDGMMQLSDIPESESTELIAKTEAWYRHLSESNETTTRNVAKYMLVNRYIDRGKRKT